MGLTHGLTDTVLAEIDRNSTEHVPVDVQVDHTTTTTGITIAITPVDDPHPAAGDYQPAEIADDGRPGFVAGPRAPGDYALRVRVAGAVVMLGYLRFT